MRNIISTSLPLLLLLSLLFQSAIAERNFFGEIALFTLGDRYLVVVSKKTLNGNSRTKSVN